MAQSRLSPLSACAVHAPPLPASALLYLGRSFPGVSRAASSEVLKMSSTLSPLTSHRPEPTCPGDLWLPDPLCALLLLPVLPQLLPLSSCPLGRLHHHAPFLSLGPRFRPPGPAARSPPAPSIWVPILVGESHRALTGAIANLWVPVAAGLAALPGSPFTCPSSAAFHIILGRSSRPLPLSSSLFTSP